MLYSLNLFSVVIYEVKCFVVAYLIRLPFLLLHLRCEYLCNFLILTKYFFTGIERLFGSSEPILLLQRIWDQKAAVTWWLKLPVTFVLGYQTPCSH